MGIKKLNDLIKKYAPGCMSVKNIGDAYANKKIAIDMSIYIFKYKAIFGDKWIISFINLLLIFIRHSICCVIVFDNPQKNIAKAKEHEKRASARKTLVLKTKQVESDILCYKKDKTISELLYDICKKHSSLMSSTKSRQFLSFSNKKKKKNDEEGEDDEDDEEGKKKGDEDVTFCLEWCEEHLEKLKKQNIKIEKGDIELVKTLIPILGMNFITSLTEAEGTCSFICHEKIVDAVLSEDTDVLAYGCKKFLTKINIADETVVEINYKKMIELFDVTQEEFLDLCVLLGTDFNCNLRGIGPEKAYKLIKEFRRIEHILENTKHTNDSITKLSFVETRKIFDITNKNLGFVESEKDIVFKQIDKEGWTRFLFENNLVDCFKHVKIC